MPVCRAVVNTEDFLGEGPVYRPAENAIYWTDIDTKRLHRWNFAAKKLDQWNLPEKIGSFGWQGDRLLLAMETGFFYFDLQSGSLDKVFSLPSTPGIRSNDGKSDPRGRFWVGTMHVDANDYIGAMYRFDPSGECKVMFGGIRCPNSLAWSPDGTTMYFADSFDLKIYAYPFDPETGEIGERRVFADTSHREGAPDGATVDAQGYLWSARCGGYALIRYSPDGTEDRVIQLPVKYPTSCTFGDSDRVLYVTTGIFDVSEEERASTQPLAGALLEVEI
jgi:sugar lactone lactonase YvrE